MGFSSVVETLLTALTIGMVYCRFMQIRVPYVDEFVIKVRTAIGFPPGGGPRAEPGTDVSGSMQEVESGKPIVLVDVLFQMKHYCGDRARGKCSEWIGKLPEVSTSLR